MNWKGFGRKLSWPEILSQHLDEGNEEKHGKPQSG
jgi:hypothetical protein